tara:strand:- start:436 stop:633 length:198 start_codon:yes stop_codon:yes gene_type:complete
MKDGPIQLTIVVLKALWRFIGGVAASDELQEDERRLHDSDLVGEYNYRTGRLDAGTDPFGWYERD